MNNKLTVMEKICIGHYENELALPDKEYIKTVFDRAGSKIRTIFTKDTSVNTAIDSIKRLATEFEQSVTSEYQRLRDSWNNNKSKKEEFKADLEEAFNMQDHPKKDIIFVKAWSEKEGQGFLAVHNEYMQLVNLVK